MKDGGPAFPTYGADEDRSADQGTMSMYLDRRTDGMTLRDYFAAKAMNGILTATCAEFEGTQAMFDVAVRRTALQSYMIADAMLEARNK